MKIKKEQFYDTHEHTVVFKLLASKKQSHERTEADLKHWLLDYALKTGEPFGLAEVILNDKKLNIG